MYIMETATRRARMKLLGDGEQGHIWVHPADRAGCGAYRLRWPAFAIDDALEAHNRTEHRSVNVSVVGTHGIYDTVSHTSTLSVVSQRPMTAESLGYLRWLRRNGKARVIIDADDLLEDMADWNIANEGCKPEHIERIVESYRMADCITVSTRYLGEVIKEYGCEADVVLRENSLPQFLWGPAMEEQPRGERPVVMWAGSSNHVGLKNGEDGDFAGVMGPLRQAIIDEKIEFVLVGGPVPALQQVLSGAKCFHYEPWSSTQEWPSNMRRIVDKYKVTVGLAPLEESEFNKCKSDLKLLEYAHCGLGAVASKWEDSPYERWKGAVDIADGVVDGIKMAHELGRCGKVRYFERDQMRGVARLWADGQIVGGLERL